MEMGDREIALFVENLISPSSISQCRICHEEEVESSKNLEAPCACSGTVKFAHRDCIQKWCNEKGNTTCEICLQKFEPGYIAPLKKAMVNEVAVTIRGSLEVPRQNQEQYSPRLMAIVALDGRIIESNYSECSSASERRNCWRSVALIFAILLLVRNLTSVLISGTDGYAISLLALFVLRAVGIFVPLYIMIQTIAAIQNNLQRHYLEFESNNTSPFEEDDEESDL